jgi:hypothetical protein
MEQKTINRYAEKIANICVEKGIDFKDLTSLQLREITNQIVRVDVYASCPTINPHALEALIAFSDSFDDCLKDFLGINPSLPFVDQCESLDPSRKYVGELLNDFARRSLVMTLKKIEGLPQR